MVPPLVHRIFTWRTVAVRSLMVLAILLRFLPPWPLQITVMLYFSEPSHSKYSYHLFCFLQGLSNLQEEGKAQTQAQTQTLVAAQLVSRTSLETLEGEDVHSDA